jgi:hypothetical protein
MAWRDTLRGLRQELAEARAEQQRQAAANEAQVSRAREELSQLAVSLGITELLSEMNSTLLDGLGQVETITSWEDSDSEPDHDEDELDFVGEEEDADFITTLLSWEEAGEREIMVELEISDEGTSLQINGVGVRFDRNALERALVEAFRDELEL